MTFPRRSPGFPLVSMDSSLGPRTSRRAALGLLGLSLALSACRAPWESTSASTSATTVPPVTDADVALVSAVIAEVTQLQGRLAAAPAGNAVAARFRSLHTEHLEQLRGMVKAASPATGSPSPSATVEEDDSAELDSGRVGALEAAHLSSLERAADRASSAAVARILATMSAAVAQLLTRTLPGVKLPSVSGRPKSLSAEEIAAVQDVLAAQHAALYVGGVLVARTSKTQHATLRDQLAQSWAAHREARDVLEVLLRSLGQRPTAAAPEYEMPGNSSSAAQIKRTALLVEQRCTSAWSALVGHSGAGAVRTWAVGANRESAVRELVFGGNPVAFPGAVQLTNR